MAETWSQDLNSVGNWFYDGGKQQYRQTPTQWTAVGYTEKKDGPGVLQPAHAYVQGTLSLYFEERAGKLLSIFAEDKITGNEFQSHVAFLHIKCICIHMCVFVHIYRLGMQMLQNHSIKKQINGIRTCSGRVATRCTGKTAHRGHVSTGILTCLPFASAFLPGSWWMLPAVHHIHWLALRESGCLLQSYYTPCMCSL